MIEQMSMFPETPEEKYERKIREIESKFERVRKNLFARQAELMKMYVEQKWELDVLKGALVRCGLKVSMNNSPVTFYTIGSNGMEIS